ncbi:MAG TPA: hypothetical protein VFW28_02020 [Micropepsaceae bacterium]|nr:hypothetical protein [Micropepsaceae bacterium]
MHKSRNNQRLLVVSLLALVAGTAAPQTANGADAPPVFSTAPQSAWVGIGIGALLPVPGSPKPIMQDPAYRYIPNGTPGQQPTQRIGDISNPNLKQWAKDVMKKDNDEVLAGKFAFTARSSCKPGGVPGFDVLLGGALAILQSPREVTMIFSGNNEVRHIMLNVPHTADPRPSWYGDSIGHYEGDTLVVDTVGLNDKSFLDNYRTPHSNKLHVTERWRLIENGAKLEILMTIDDPETFNQPWQALRQYDRVNRGFDEDVCSENNSNHFDFDFGTPVAEKPDF